MMTSAKHGCVLQGYFHLERFRRAVAPAAAARPDPAPRPPRPELLPATMQRPPAQARFARASGDRGTTASRPPGMGLVTLPGALVTPQARTAPGVSATLIPDGRLWRIGEGRPLEAGIRQAMEQFFQADLSSVRVHEGPMAQAMGALAFTLGDELHFAPGMYDPRSRDGVALLGHELTHVLQQRAGRVANPYGHGTAIVQDPALEAEAERIGQLIAAELWSDPRRPRHRVPAGRATRPHPGGPPSAAQPMFLLNWLTGGGGDEPPPKQPPKKPPLKVTWSSSVTLSVGRREAFFTNSHALHAVFAVDRTIYGLKGDLGGGEIAVDEVTSKPYTWVNDSIRLTAWEMNVFFECAQNIATSMTYTLFTYNCYSPVTGGLVAVRDTMDSHDSRRQTIARMINDLNQDNFGLGQYGVDSTSSDIEYNKKKQ